MADNKNKEILEIGVDTKGAITDFSKFERALTVAMKGIGDAVEAMGKKNEDVTKQAQKDTRLWTDNLDDLKKAYKSEGDEITKMEAMMTALSKKANKASAEEVANIEEQVEQLKKMRSEKAKGLKGRAANDEKFSKGKESVREEAKEAFKAFFHKDFKKLAESGMKTLVKSLKLASVGGKSFRDKGMELQNRGSARGGLSGKAMSAAGSALKGVGAGASKVGELVEGLSKLGPILGLVGTAVMGIVALFLDLDAKSKAFNADIMKTASNAEFLAASGGDVDGAFDHVKSTLTGIRKAAISFDNIKWGISPEEHTAIVNVLNQEGVSLQTIERSAIDAAKANKTYTESFEGNTKAVEDFQTELAHVSVAYSRAFGVPLQAINQLQGEMFKEMGVSLEHTGKAFEEMYKEASKSDIAVGTFFDMIRGVSSDLSLWTTRMDSAVKLLGKLGTAMSPRNASKFMATLIQGNKGKNQVDLVQQTMMVGIEETRKLNAQSIKRSEKALAKTLKLGDRDINTMSEDELEDAVKALDPKQRGEARGALYQRKIMKAQNATKGAVGVANASGNMDTTAVLQSNYDRLLKLSNAKNLTEAMSKGGLGLYAQANNGQGFSNDTVMDFGKLENSAEMQRKMLKKKLTSSDKNDQNEAKESLKSAGIEADSLEGLIEKVNKAGVGDLTNTLNEIDQDKPDKTDQQNILDAALKQNDLTQSWQKKFDMFVDWAMNSLFQVLLDIYELLAHSKLFGTGEMGAKADVAAAKSPELTKIMQESAGVNADFQKALFKQGSTFSVSLLKALKGDKKGDVEEQISEGFKRNGTSDMVTSAAEGAGLDDKTIERLSEATLDQIDLVDKLKNLNIDDDKRAAFMHQIAGMLSPTELPKLFSKVVVPAADANADAQASTGGGLPSSWDAAPASSGYGPPAPSAQQAPSSAAPAATAAKAAETATDSLSMSTEQTKTLRSIDNQMDKFKMDTTFLKGPYKDTMGDSVLKAVRTALFEYYMYKDLKQEDVVKAMSGGMNGASYSQSYSTGANAGRTGQQQVNFMNGVPAAPAHASGGMVTGIANGMAVTAAAGEGLASIGKGERIIPKGAGGGGTGPITVNVNGVGGDDLAKVIQAKVIDGIYEYKRRERFTP